MLSIFIRDISWSDYLEVMMKARVATCIAFIPGTEYFREKFPERANEARCNRPYLIGINITCDSCGSNLE